MAELTKREIDAIHETHDKVIELVSIIGNGDNKGLCYETRSLRRRITRLEIVLAAIIGSGTLGGGIAFLTGLIG